MRYDVVLRDSRDNFLNRLSLNTEEDRNIRNNRGDCETIARRINEASAITKGTLIARVEEVNQ